MKDRGKSVKEPFLRRVLWGGYNLLLGGAGVVASPILAYKMAITPRWRVGWDERITLSLPPAPQSDPVIWFHAVSVGEVMGIAPLVRAMRERYPHASIYLSTVTATGKDTALERLGDVMDHHFFLPLDWSFLVKRVVSRVKPRLFVVMETEIWPNLLHVMALRGTKIAMVNGRLSPSSFKRYCSASPLLKSVLGFFHVMAMQSPRHAARTIFLGAPQERVKAVGNLKYDQVVAQLEGVNPQEVRAIMGLKEGEEVLVAGSTHPGEEALLLDAFSSLKREFPHLVLLLAPRHPRRREEVEGLIRGKGFSWVRRTEIERRRQEPVILLDSVGELAGAYSMARLVFVGGSLVDRGGHNPLEPAFFSKPILMGPSYYNFREVVDDLLRREGIHLTSPSSLLEDMRAFLKDRGRASLMGRRAREVLMENKGALKRHLELLEPLLTLRDEQEKGPDPR